MAKVKMDFRDLDDYELPDVCIQCGAPAEGRKGKRYSWYPPALNLLILAGVIGWIILAILVNVLTKRRSVNRPLCAVHINQWPWRTLTALGGFALLVLTGLAAFFVMVSDDRRGGSNPLGGYLCIGAFVVLIVWLVVVAVIQSTAIRPTVITDGSITLVNVSKEFALAYEDEMEQAPRSRIDDEVRDRWRDRDRERLPKTPRPPSDAFEPE
jgi:hypothetical protein